MKNMPAFHDQLMPVTERLACCRDGDTAVYFFDGLPVFSHHVLDIVRFHMITASFCVRGHAEAVEIADAFGVDAEGIELAIALYEDMGPDGFYPERTPVPEQPKASLVGKKTRTRKKR